ncbi:unnamed protein product [Eruca vesicaria subsp. sativa]|uniref:Morc S5 domain-containing protein n=1 Tax=Eruca vesicaria subsp. sativa TaxID=29727 RepID=A0ABC8M1G0_ERUVS|nr:unnamed protein product [Eruca vesicaria subsp. sativa]
MDSSPNTNNPKKPLLVIGGTTNTGISNPKPSGPPPGFSSKPSIKRYSDDVDFNNLAIKKTKTVVSAEDGKKIVALDVKPLAIVEAENHKLSRQFWKAGDDKEDEPVPRYCSNDAAVRVHPQFLHANATSHKWALGALAELLDNSLDEVCNGATYVHVNSATNQKDGKSSILIVEDNGGGMDPGRFRECLSLGYSRKRNMPNKVGQYGNGFKTSTMRLGADAIVFSRCQGTNGNKTTQSIGMLSYTFLYETRKCEAIVPTVDFELVDNAWKEITYNSTDDWFDNLETIVKWSPFSTQQELFDQFNFLEDQGTRIVIYNLWEDDEGKLELDFDTDPHDIQLRGVNRDEKNIEMAKTYPNSRHFLTYRHSLRVRAFMFLNTVLMCELKCSLTTDLKLGFVKDAHHHIDIQGFNVYHKNRLIKPFWRVWNAAGSDGRGVIGLVEANFIQPAHNKQGFERTVVLAKLESRLLQLQKNYWSSRCQEIGYAPRRKQANHLSVSRETTRQGDKKFEVPFNNMKHDKGSSSNAPPARFMQNGQSSWGNQLNSQGVTQSRVAERMIPDSGTIKMEKHGHGIRFNEARLVEQAAELQRQTRQLELQLKAKIQDFEKMENLKDDSEKLVSKLLSQLKQSEAKIQNMEKTQKGANDSDKLVVELSNQLKQSNAKIQDLEKTQKLKDDESAKMVDELKRQKALLEEDLQKVKDGSNKLVDELRREKAMLEEESHKVKDESTKLVDELKQSKAKIQDMEKSQTEVTEIFQEERARRDGIEHDLRKKLREASDDIRVLKFQVNSLEAQKAKP